MWCKLSDLFDAHPKILALGTDQRRWTWLRIILYTTRYESPEIPTSIAESVPKATTSFLHECAQLALIDIETDGTMRVHNWHEYNGRAAEQRERERDKKRRQRGHTGDNNGDKPGDISGTVPGDSRGRLPSRPLTKNVVDKEEQGARSFDDDEISNTTTGLPLELAGLLAGLGVVPSSGELRELLADPGRALVTARAAGAPGVRQPRSWFWSVWRTGQYPSEPVGGLPVGPVRSLGEVLAAWVRNVGRVVSLADVAAEVAEREAQRGETLDAVTRAGLLDLWRSMQPNDAGDAPSDDAAAPGPDDEPPSATLRDVA